MTEQYYGYTPTRTINGVFAGFTDDYLNDAAVTYTPTQWDSVDIEQMWEYVRGESDERTIALAEAWRRTSVLLQTTRENLKRHADGLTARWQSPAGHYFMSKVGAALHSLDEWKEVADRHASGLEQLASKIAQTQRDMRELWLTYQAEQQHQDQRRRADQGIQFSDLFGLNNGKSFKEVQQEFHARAKNIVKPLAELYIDVSYANIYRGGRYKGPTEAAEFNPEQFPQSGRPNAPVGLPPAPTVPGDGPKLLSRLEVTPPPSPRELPDGVGLAGGTVTAPPPTPGPPPAAPPIPTTPTPAPVPPPVLPGVNGPTAPRPSTPTTSRPGIPRPTLPGTSSPGALGPAPNPHRPTPPNTGTPNPTHRGPSPNRATLPGHTGAPQPHSLHPGTRPARPTPPPPTLSGKHSTSPSSIAHPTPPPTANRPTPSIGNGTRASGPLTGRSAVGSTRPAPATGPTPSLGGRRGTPITPRTRARQAPEKAESWEHGEGDDELWTTDPPPASTIDTPAEPRPRHHGKALGQSSPATGRSHPGGPAHSM